MNQPNYTKRNIMCECNENIENYENEKEYQPEDFYTEKEVSAMESVMKKMINKAFDELIKENPKYKSILKKYKDN